MLVEKVSNSIQIVRVRCFALFLIDSVDVTGTTGRKQKWFEKMLNVAYLKYNEENKLLTALLKKCTRTFPASLHCQGFMSVIWQQILVCLTLLLRVHWYLILHSNTCTGIHVQKQWSNTPYHHNQLNLDNHIFGHFYLYTVKKSRFIALLVFCFSDFLLVFITVLLFCRK